MNAPPFIELDDTDERIVELLRRDGRMPYRAMAADLGVTEATVRSRVRRLEGSNAMRVVAVTDFQAAGFELMLAVGIKVDARAPQDVAEDLAMIPEVFSINLVIGAFDIEILVVAEDQAALAELIYQRLAAVPGVLRVATALAVDVLKNQPDSVPLSVRTAHSPDSSGSGGASRRSLPQEGGTSEASMRQSADGTTGGEHANKAISEPDCAGFGAGLVGSRSRLDETDLSIVGHLGRDARTSNRQIAEQVGVTEGTVRARIKRMTEDRQIRITAVTNIDRYRDAAIAYIWVEVESSNKAQQVARQMADMQEFGFVGLMVGRFDILGITMVRNTEHLAHFVHRHISGLPGVRRTESTLSVNFVKHDYRMSRIVG